MIHLTRETRILLGVRPADFRKGIDGFQGICREALGEDPRDGTLYVFINRAKTMIRAIAYDQGGFWLMTKRLSAGRFGGWPVFGEPVSAASARELRALLAGGEWQRDQDADVAIDTNQSLAHPFSSAPSCVTV